MHFGFGVGPRSTYIDDSATSAEWFDEDTMDNALFTGYVAMNHPNSESDSGWDFVGYDFNPGFYVEIDPDECITETTEDGEEIETCGMVMIDEDTDEYIMGNFNVDADTATRHAYLTSWSWWYEDFPNLDLDIMGEGFDWLYEGDEE